MQGNRQQLQQLKEEKYTKRKSIIATVILIYIL